MTQTYAQELADYNEILLQAMQIVVDSQLSKLQFDKTIVCTIEDITERDKGIYTVSNGSLTFEASSEKTDYSKSEQVLVLVTDGDWSKTKYILGREKGESDKPITYVAPSNQFIALTEDNLITSTSNSWSIYANGSAQSEICSIENQSFNTTIYNTLYLKGLFKTLFSNYTMTSGEYGLLAIVFGKDGETGIYKLSNLQDMFGNTYNFSDWSVQEQAFKISSSIGIVESIKVYLYQKGNFTYASESDATEAWPPWPSDEPAIVQEIQVKDVVLALGANTLEVSNNSVQIYTNDNDKYNSTSSNKKDVQLIWYNKTEDNVFTGFTDATAFDEKKATGLEKIEETDTGIYYWIEWFADDDAGNLQPIDNPENVDNETRIVEEIQFSAIPMTEVQAVVWVNGQSYKSNKLQFFNELGDAAGKFDVEYCFQEISIGTPSSKPELWYDPLETLPEGVELNDAIWMATRNSDDGGNTWTPWVVTRIRGKDGKDGENGITPYTVELTNDSATVGLDVDGKPIGLEDITSTRAVVYYANENITGSCTYEWSTDKDFENTTYVQGQGAEAHLKEWPDGATSVKMNVNIFHGTVNIGQKSMNITTIPSTDTYKLLVSPQVVDRSNDAPTITLSIIKYTNGKSQELNEYKEEEYTIEYTPEAGVAVQYDESKKKYFAYLDMSTFKGTTFSLYKDGQLWDSETVSFQSGSQFTSTVFARTATKEAPDTPQGGTYDNPIPQIEDEEGNLTEDKTWHDGIPEGEGVYVWSSQAVFKDTNGDFDPQWSIPVLMADVADKFDVQYTPNDPPQTPVSGANGWFDGTAVSAETLKNVVWMATRTKNANGEWKEYIITRVKGEKGEKGDSGDAGSSPYQISLSNDMATIGTDSAGNYDQNALKMLSMTQVSVSEGTSDISTQCLYTWSVSNSEENLIEKQDGGRTIYFTQLNDDTATATVDVQRVLTDNSKHSIGSKVFTIVKQKQGESGVSGADAINCYIESSLGTLFETNQSGTTTLYARVYKGNVEITDEFTYDWYIGTEKVDNHTDKSYEIDISSLKNKSVYFIAEKINKE